MSEFAERLLRESRQLTQIRLDELIKVDPRACQHSLNSLWQKAATQPDQEPQALILVLDSFAKQALVEKGVGNTPPRRASPAAKRTAHTL